MSGEELNSAVLTETGDSLDDVKRKLFDRYSNTYRIVNYGTEFTNGFLGFWKKPYVKAHYTVERPKIETESPIVPVSTQNSFQKSREELLKKQGLDMASTMQMLALNKKIEELQATLGAKMDQISVAANAVEKHPTIAKIEELLAANEFTLSYIKNITTRIREEFSLDDLEDFDKIERHVVDMIGSSIQIAKALPHKLPHVIVIVGPTGVGKTTTVAKIAASMILRAQDKKQPRPDIRMLTIDRMRVGAEAQLRNYGEALGVPVDAAETAKGVREVFEENKDSLDALLIDTSGFSPNDHENIGRMRDLLDIPDLHPDVYLAVDASKKAHDIESIIRNYELFNFNSVIITKCDETTAYGNVLSVLSEKGKKISFITDGQVASRHFERASVVKFLTRLNDFTIDRLHIEDTFPEE